ncbi:hypothetical protein M3152_02555 [Sporosarcina luteola]|uniref:hypothetical protein n=1 Tax=Sporosarcina luteola TaxID=582850 RepID=UPI0020426584|nr:hypothetical protein [Sporosarcina luteola]MCM3636587.1 hypothetical protein [Sporosarcina luteola]
MEELEAILETIDVTDPTEQTDDSNLQDSTDLTEQTEDPLLQETTEPDNITEYQDLNKSPEINTDEEIEAYKNWKQSLRIIPRALASGTNFTAFRLSLYQLFILKPSFNLCPRIVLNISLSPPMRVWK